MFSWRRIVSAAAFGALHFAMLAPGAASAHPGHAHPVAAKHAAAPLAAKDGAASAGIVRAELKAHIPGPTGRHVALDCLDPGCCCSNGHCAGCCNALAPAAFAVFGPPQSVRLGNPDSTRPTALVREGPPRPPTSLV
jgi:hypothetical protein